MAISQKQKAVLEEWVNNPYVSFTEIQKRTNTSKTQFYKWRQDKEFMEEYHRMCQERFAELEAVAVEKLREQVNDGQWNAVRYVLDNKQYGAAQKVELETNTITVTLMDD